MKGSRSPRAFPITAYAAGNALGESLDEVVNALRDGRSSLRPPPFELPFATCCGVFAGELPAPPISLRGHDSRVARIALSILEQLSDPIARAVSRRGADRVAVVVGTSTGGILQTEQAHAVFAATGSLPPSFNLERQHAFGGLLEVVRARTGARGPGYVVSTACSSSAKVLGAARRLLAAGLADAVLVGGVDSLCETTLRGFASLQALSARPCRPFSVHRDGTSIGEGGAFLLVERDGDAAVWLLGVGESQDAHHMSHPHPDGLGAQLAMQQALNEAGVEPGSVDHVNAHGTATLANDIAEARAIAAVLGAHVPVSSTKGYAGHLLGAAGATEAVFAALSIERSFLPASLGAAPLDPAIAITVCERRRDGPVRMVLSNSLGFGGSNASVLLGAAA